MYLFYILTANVKEHCFFSVSCHSFGSKKHTKIIFLFLPFTYKIFLYDVCAINGSILGAFSHEQKFQS